MQKVGIKSPADNTCGTSVGLSATNKDIVCPWRTVTSDTWGKCGLGMYGGPCSNGVARRCIKLGQNNEAYAANWKTRPRGKPKAWLELEAQGIDPRSVFKAPPATLPPRTAGAGWELKRILAAFGIRPAPNCKCFRRASKMDKKGPDWCEQNLDMIVEWLREEATNRKWLFSEFAARQMIRHAIKKARRRLTKRVAETPGLLNTPLP